MSEQVDFRVILQPDGPLCRTDKEKELARQFKGSSGITLLNPERICDSTGRFCHDEYTLLSDFNGDGKVDKLTVSASFSRIDGEMRGFNNVDIVVELNNRPILFDADGLNKIRSCWLANSDGEKIIRKATAKISFWDHSSVQASKSLSHPQEDFLDLYIADVEYGEHMRDGLPDIYIGLKNGAAIILINELGETE